MNRFSKEMRKLIALLLLVCFMGILPARAQVATGPHLFALDASAFPTMTALLDVYDSAGNFITGLTTSSVVLLEDNQTHPLDKLEELQPGVQFVVALDPGPDFAARDSNAVTRLDKVVSALQTWAKALPANTADDLNLVATGGGTPATNLTPSAFQDALSAYKPSPLAITPTLDTLSKALDIASEPTTQPGMKREVLFISSPPSAAAFPTLQNLAARALQMEIQVSVWIVTSSSFFKTDSATALKDLSITTGGQVALFSGAETLPSPESYLSPLRHTYRLIYTSAITAPGSHTLAVQVNENGTPATSIPLTFEMNVQPPNPMLVSPPAQIVRQIPDPRLTDLAALQPESQTINILVEFPDGHKRPLVSTTLLVDGQPVAEKTTAPFDQFTWDLRGYTSSGVYTLEVKAVDSLGLSKTSLGIPVTITVILPKRGLAAFLSRNNRWVAIGAVLLAGGVLAVILAGGRRRRRTRRSSRSSRNDPLTQPVSGEAVRGRRPAGKRGLRLPWAGLNQNRTPLAYLIRMKDDGAPVTAPPVPITNAETTFGTDPTRATYLLDDPSVSPLHARLRQEANGSFLLSDEKSIAGTWVNYQMLSAPCRVQHGDVIHFGRISYRFMLPKPPEKPGPRLTPSQT